MSTTLEYSECAQKVQAAVKEVDRVKDILAEASRAMMYWKMATVSGLSHPIPAAEALRAKYSSYGSKPPSVIRASDWPTPQVIFDALNGYHSAVAKLRECYQSLPQNEKLVAQTPDRYEGQDETR